MQLPVPALQGIAMMKACSDACSVTSAVPKMKQKPAEGQRPEMYFEESGMPEAVS